VAADWTKYQPSKPFSTPGVAIEWDEHIAGWAAVEKGGPAISGALLDSVHERGSCSRRSYYVHPVSRLSAEKSTGNYNVQLRKAFGLLRRRFRRLKNFTGLDCSLLECRSDRHS
jgi:hypothetical protein